MIQFNLLPDVKLEYIKTKRVTRMITFTAVSIASVALGIMVLLFVVVNVLQKQHLNNLTKEIKSNSKKLEETPDLDKILTVQNQLNKLSDLHSKKPVATRLSTYMSQLTPAKVTVAKLDIDFETSTMAINGSTDSLATINKFVDTLKFTDYKYNDTTTKAFSDVVLSSFGLAEGKASYLISFKFDPVIFSSDNQGRLIVPNTITTRSATERPEGLFKPLTVPLEEGQ